MDRNKPSIKENRTYLTKSRKIATIFSVDDIVSGVVNFIDGTFITVEWNLSGKTIDRSIAKFDLYV